ncbi:hypothetical protein [Shewanella mangrovi]|uniref:hypothetical protein n=1 Tax=Shewanella mangrovi TaxID=1515746 RepID=UPI000A983C8C|nr:hypothetical protein [Shewanella mangrovi]
MDSWFHAVLQGLAAIPAPPLKALAESMAQSRMLLVMCLLAIALLLALGWLIFSY